MNIKKQVTDLNNMILHGQIFEAFDKYYHTEVVMQENEEAPRKGKAANLDYEKQFVESVAQWHGSEIKSLATGEDTSMVEWFMDIEFKNGHRVKRNQVAIQQWKDGKIVHEKFYYNNC